MSPSFPVPISQSVRFDAQVFDVESQLRAMETAGARSRRLVAIRIHEEPQGFANEKGRSTDIRDTAAARSGVVF